jgi:iron complex outermembrane recepter protein
VIKITANKRVFDFMKISTSGYATSLRSAFLAGAAAASLALPGVAFAQASDEAQPAADAPAEEVSEEGNEIVVTATKREQTLQEVPVAVSVTTAETIERAQIRDLKDLTSIVPSLRVNTLQSSANTNFIIRGFGNGANNAGIEPSVGVFIDGVYRSRSAAQIADLPDVQRVEVLRGPQSTLFGKNASAGVVSMTTQKPKFKFGGNVEASYGSLNALVLKGVVTGPLSENVAASLALGYNKRDGYTRDLGTGNRTNERNRWFVRGQMLFEPGEATSIRLIGDYGKIDENCCGVVNLQTGAATGALIALGAKVNAPADKFGGVVYTNVDSVNKIENYGFSGEINHEFGILKLTSITALRKVKAITNQDSDFTSGDLLGRNFQDVGIKTFTQEFRVSANFVDKVNVLLGAFYFNEKINQANQVTWGNLARNYGNLLVLGQSGCALSIIPGSPCTTPGGPTPTSLEATFGALEGNPAKYIGQFLGAGQGLNETYRLSDNSISIFGQLDFEISDRLTLTGGINYTKDNKKYSTNVISNDVFAGIDFNAAGYAPFRNSLLRGGAIASSVGTALGLGRSATTAEITAFATGASPAGLAGATAFATQISPGATAFANANQNNPAANPLNGLKAFQFFPPFLNVPNAVESGKLSDSNVSFTARLAYDASDDVNTYLSFSTGYKPPSVNLSRDSRPLASDAAAITSRGLAVVNQTYGTRFAGNEKTTVYEAGLKAKWDWGTVNAAVFYQAIKGFQSNLFVGTGFVLSNAGKQSTWGQEVEATFKPVSPLTLGVSLTFLQPKYDDYKLSAFGDASGTTPAGIPKFSGTFSAQYDHEMGNGDHLILRGDFHTESKVQLVEGLPNFVTTSAAGVRNLQAGIDAARPFTRSVNEFNASLTYAMGSGLEATIWGRNISNNRYISTIFDSPAQQFSVSGYPNQPRTWGGSIRYRF